MKWKNTAVVGMTSVINGMISRSHVLDGKLTERLVAAGREPAEQDGEEDHEEDAEPELRHDEADRRELTDDDREDTFARVGPNATREVPRAGGEIASVRKASSSDGMIRSRTALPTEPPPSCTPRSP